MINIVLFGPPGAGKGTQAFKLKSHFDLLHISTGDLLRSEIISQTKLGLEAKSFMDAGKLVPDQVVIGMIREQLKNNPDAKGNIFDGFPRTVVQAEALDNLLAEYSTEISRMIALEVEDDELVRRLLLRGKDSGRPDDQDKRVISSRIVEYNKKTSPLIEYYSNKNKFKSIEGVGVIEEIFQNLVSEIDTLI